MADLSPLQILWLIFCVSTLTMVFWKGIGFMLGTA